jgi:hypothetical protein
MGKQGGVLETCFRGNFGQNGSICVLSKNAKSAIKIPMNLLSQMERSDWSARWHSLLADLGATDPLSRVGLLWCVFGTDWLSMESSDWLVGFWLLSLSVCDKKPS